jgi:hypothetical protein
MNITSIYNRILSRLNLRNEEYVSSVASTVKNKSKEETFFPIFKNPDKSEIKELKKFGVSVRFIVYKKDVFVFPSELLHNFAVRELHSAVGIPRDLYSDAMYDPRIAFFGIAKINLGTMKLSVTDTNQTMTPETIEYIEKNYKFMDRYFE